MRAAGSGLQAPDPRPRLALEAEEVWSCEPGSEGVCFRGPTSPGVWSPEPGAEE